MDYKAITWSPEEEQITYREWGAFYTKKQNYDVADMYYNKSLELNPNDSKVLFRRSQCKRRIAQAADGLADAERSLSLEPLSQPINLEVCDGIYEQNEFEKAAYHLENFSRKFSGRKLDAFSKRQNYVEENFNETLGDTLGYFILENEGTLHTVHKLMDIAPDKRPLWKILKEKEECDVLSIPEKKIVHLNPREIARRQREYLIFNQIYLPRSWTDVLFLKGLRNNPDLMLPQSHLSRPLLEKLTNAKCLVVEKLIKMLNARCPLYTKKIFNCPSRERRIMLREQFLFRTQHQVHRDMLKMLRRMRDLRSRGELKELREYIEKAMGDYVVLKTHRVMPTKFKFLNEVYNILALAICDKLVEMPADVTDNTTDRLMALLKIKKQSEKENVTFEFGKKPSQAGQNFAEKEAIKLKAFTARLTERLRFAKYPIERAYLWHEFARTELKQHAFDRCCVLATKCIDEADLCNSHLWKLHGLMMIVRAHAILKKIENIKSTLANALNIVPQLNDQKVTQYLNILNIQNNRDIAIKFEAEKFRRVQYSSLTSLRKSKCMEI